MPFGISSAPEVSQHRMHEIIGGLQGIEVVADDFMAVGFGETLEQATRNHDDHLELFLQHCDEKNIKLNDTKIKLPRSTIHWPHSSCRWPVCGPTQSTNNYGDVRLQPSSAC